MCASDVFYSPRHVRNSLYPLEHFPEQQSVPYIHRAPKPAKWQATGAEVGGGVGTNGAGVTTMGAGVVEEGPPVHVMLAKHDSPGGHSLSNP
jgi:hypothetical protein